MKVLLLILQFTCCGMAFSQKIPIEKINSILISLDYSKLEKAIPELRKNKSCVIWKEYHREIIEDYKEGYFEIQNNFPKNWMSLPDFEDSTYVIKLVTKGNKIIFYEFGRKNYKTIKQEGRYHLEDNYSFKNNSMFETFKTKFKELYEVDLIESELCHDWMLVGQICGFGAFSPLKDYATMERFVINKKTDSLLIWLRSANTEKQMYGLWGFYKLSLGGEALSENILKLVNVVRNKKGSIKVCGGCDVVSQSIETFTKGFKFN